MKPSHTITSMQQFDNKLMVPLQFLWMCLELHILPQQIYWEQLDNHLPFIY